MYGLDGSYSAAVSFVLGCDAATSGVLLSGFREWLIVRLGDGNNLAWTALVTRIVSPGMPVPNEEATAGLFQLLDEFLALRDRRDGMARIYDQYLRWLKSQEWYRDDMLS